MSQHKPGRVRTRIAKLLLAKGIFVQPEELWTQEGGDRSVDCARWGSLNAKWVNDVNPDGEPYHWRFHVHSWDTMTACLKCGIQITKDRSDGWREVEVHRNEPEFRRDEVHGS